MSEADLDRVEPADILCRGILGDSEEDEEDESQYGEEPFGEDKRGKVARAPVSSEPAEGDMLHVRKAVVNLGPVERLDFGRYDDEKVQGEWKTKEEIGAGESHEAEILSGIEATL